MKFMNRGEAGRRLADKLLHLKDQQPVVLALPRGGVAVGFEIAQALDAPLDIVLVRKIGIPWQPELALGAVTDGAEGDSADVADALVPIVRQDERRALRHRVDVAGGGLFVVVRRGEPRRTAVIRGRRQRRRRVQLLGMDIADKTKSPAHDGAQQTLVPAGVLDRPAHRIDAAGQR